MNKAQLAELDAVIKLLKEHPERHNQRAWARFDAIRTETPPQPTRDLSCGSAFCIAGAVVARTGATLEWEFDYYRGAWFGGYVTQADGTLASISDKAVELLGLTWDEASQLFDGWNSMEDIERMRDELAVTYGLA